MNLHILRQTHKQIHTLLAPFLIFALISISTWELFRLGFIIWQSSRVLQANMLITSFLQGIRFDSVSLGLIFLIPLPLTPLLCTHPQLQRLWKKILLTWLTTAFILLVFMEIATPSFISQYDARPNTLFIEYLIYPNEILHMLWGAYKLQLLCGIISIGLATWIAYKTLNPRITQLPTLPPLTALLLSPLLLIISVMMIRSTTDHRPVNPSTVAISQDPMVNDLPLNSLYTLLYAGYQLSQDDRHSIRYGNMSDAQAISITRQHMHLPPEAFTSTTYPTQHKQQATTQQRHPQNLIIILQESLGAEFVGSLGGQPLTPELDQLAQQGLWFKNLYATGTRSARGIEAVITGFPPTPAVSIIKRSKAQRDFATLASILSRYGYHNSFIYGGESQFDNMRRFFMSNGFHTSIDKKDYQNPVFAGSWGVSDEDLFNRAHQEFSKHGNQPFFSLVFTSSNHSPYEYPDNRISLYEPNKNTVNNAVKYADYALGQYIQTARHSNYWHNTLFLIVADHNSRVYGANLVPIERFHIPGLILGATIQPATYTPIASQIDLAPTLLSLLGISSEHPMTGRDLTRPIFANDPGRAIMQYYDTQAYMQGDQVIILQKGQPAQQYQYQTGQLTLTEPDPALIDTAIAHSIWPTIAYRDRLHQLPKP